MPLVRIVLSIGGCLGFALVVAQSCFAQSLATADQLPIWKTIKTGTYRSVINLREALQAADCALPSPTVSGRTLMPIPCQLGDAANEIMGRREFELSRAPNEIELVRVSGKDLGFAADSQPSLREIYQRAEGLGYALCPPEAGPQLRLQYTNQRIGEFLLIAMRPIRDYDGDLTIFSVGNGGSGLSLVGHSGVPDFRVPASNSFVFMRAPQAGADDIARATDH